MANAVRVSFLLAVALGASARASAWPWPWTSEACAEPGAVREESEGGVSVCVAGEGWRRMLAHGGLDDLYATTRVTAPNCTGRPGELVCDTTCSAVGICLNDDYWFSSDSQACSNTQICLEGTCEPLTTQTCSTQPAIQCLQTGYYPSLTDCTNYYYCDISTGGIGNLQGPCSDGLVFDACTGECDIVLAAGEECAWAISEPCAEPGTLGVAPNNDRLYYVCVQSSSGIYQLWNKCTTGHFNLTSLTCDNAGVPGCGPSPTTTTTTEGPTVPPTTPDDPNATDETDSTTTPTTTTTEPPPFECTTAGVHDNPLTNCSFYYCYADGSYMQVFCLDGYYFNSTVGGCVLGQCA